MKLGDLLLRLAERGRIGKGLRHGLAGHAAGEAKLWIMSRVVVFSAVAGRLVLQFDDVDTVSGAKILLRGGTGVSGGEGGALTAVSALWYGPDASMSVGTVINAYVNQDQRIPVP